jgi:hypothetical protein
MCRRHFNEFVVEHGQFIEPQPSLCGRGISSRKRCGIILNWRVLLRGSEINDPDHASRVCLLCCALHNWLHRKRGVFDEALLPNGPELQAQMDQQIIVDPVVPQRITPGEQLRLVLSRYMARMA